MNSETVEELVPGGHLVEKKTMIFGHLVNATTISVNFHAGTRKSLSDFLSKSALTVNRICLDTS